MNKCAEIADDYRRVTVAGAWYGPSLAELLARITPEHAVTKPEGGTHSIRELLQHLLLWNERIRKTNETCPMPKWEAEKEWGEAPIPWNELLERWNKSRDLLEERLRNFPVEDLGKQTPGRTYPYEFLLHGIVQHTIWHSGQIAMVHSVVKGA
ncbi:MAG TPA: DinB family protein [Candidatus Acidoferrum sp.]|nr:DinB family protein [Candidatus Acidoferrum sp.]